MALVLKGTGIKQGKKLTILSKINHEVSELRSGLGDSSGKLQIRISTLSEFHRGTYSRLVATKVDFVDLQKAFA